MEGLFAVIFIIIGIASAVQKQRENQSKGHGGMSRQQGQYRQRPSQNQNHIPQQPKRTFMDMGKSWGEGLKGAEEYMPSQVIWEESEGIEIEDRRRAGSLDYVEQSQSFEGTGIERQEIEQNRKKEQKAAAKIEVVNAAKEDGIFEITEDNLISSIIMAEIIGPPRSMKRNIR